MISLKNILVATDFGELSDAALLYGRAFAAVFGTTLHLLHVTDNVGVTGFGDEAYVSMAPDIQRDIDDAARERLHELLFDGDNSDSRTVVALAHSHTPALSIVQYAEDKDIDLIVIGTHGRGPLAHLLLGSVAERVVRLAPCPVLTVRHPERDFIWADPMTAVAHV